MGKYTWCLALFFVLACSGNQSSRLRSRSQIPQPHNTQEIIPSADACDSGLEAVVLGAKGPFGKLRVTICSDYVSASYLNQIVLSVSGENPLVFTRHNVILAQGINESLFYNMEKFAIEVKNDKVQFTLAGGKGKEWLFVLPSGEAVAIIPNLADPFGQCFSSTSGERYSVKDLVAGSAKLRMHLCTGGFGTSGTYSFTIVGIDIVDGSASLPAPVDTKIADFELNNFVTERRFHHNECNSLVIKLPDATYGISTHVGIYGFPNCELPGAPIAPTGDAQFARYRIQYRDADVVEGDLNSRTYYR